MIGIAEKCFKQLVISSINDAQKFSLSNVHRTELLNPQHPALSEAGFKNLSLL